MEAPTVSDIYRFLLSMYASEIMSKGGKMAFMISHFIIAASKRILNK